jgi:hypothetical protein
MKRSSATRVPRGTMGHALRGGSRLLLLENAGLSIPRNNEDRPRGTTQDPFGHGALSEPPPPSSSVGSQNDDIDPPGIGMKHDQPGRITVLLFDPHLYARRFCTFPKMGEIVEPLACARGESKVGRSCVQQKQLRITDDGEPERTVERWFARLLEIYCAENPCEVPHASTSLVIGPSRRQAAEPSCGMCPVRGGLAIVLREGGDRANFQRRELCGVGSEGG